MDAWDGAWGFAWGGAWDEIGAIEAPVGDSSAPSKNVVYYDSVRATSLSIDGGPVYEYGTNHDLIDIAHVLTGLFSSTIRKAA